MCKVGPNCNRRICFFAHKPEELRPLPPHLVGTTGTMSTGKYSLSATRQAAAAARPKAALCSQPYAAAAAHMLHQQQPYVLDPQAVRMAGAYSSSADMMLPQPFDMGATRGMLAQDPTAWQYQQLGASSFSTSPQLMAGSSLITQMQQLGLAGIAAARATPPSSTCTMPLPTCGTPVLGSSSPWAVSSEPLATSQHELMGDALMHSWAQQQQQHSQPPLLQDPTRSVGGVEALLTGAAPQFMMLPNPQQQQQQLLMHLFGTQGLAYARSLAQGQAATAPGSNPYARFGPQHSAPGMMQAAPLSDVQGPWLM